MIPCPHCGAANSVKKQVCYNCRKELASSAAADAVTPGAVTPATPAPAPATDATSEPPPPAPTPRVRNPQPLRIPAWQQPLFNLGATVSQRMQFFRQLEHLLQAGIPMVMAMGHLENQLPMHMRPMVRDFSERVQRGEMLSDSMARYPQSFVEWEISIMHAAELSGDLQMACREIADTLEMEEGIRRRVSSSTFYLRMVVATAIFVGLLLPNLGGIQGQVGNLLPALEKTAQQYCVVMAVLILLWSGWLLFVRTRQGMLISSSILARLPLFGPLIRNMMRARFTLVLSALWNAGVAPMEAMPAAARASGNGRLLRHIERNIQRIAQGESVTTLVEETRFFAQPIIYLMRTGETTGNYPEALRKATEYIRLDIETQGRALPQQLYIFFFFLIAGFVGWFVIQFYVGNLFKEAIDMLKD